MDNNRYYFTYGTEGQPFIGGWTIIEAPTRKLACEIFRTYHPDKTEGILNCSSVYTEFEFMMTKMFDYGNFGERTREYIGTYRSVLK